GLSFYLYALLFVAFDVEIIFIYIWALNFKVLLMDGLISMAIFIGVLLVGLAYAWRKGVLSWR
ncbi:MAG: NADH-quinone oxidoreductase subunit A, partial [Chloroflexi bacterium]|nr:NADH-quinone oxidoreductase subunit A [Chloroflexota bacterium]